jgi:two-component system, LytTR family, response regulator
MKIRAIIVDDEPLAREGIRTFLADEADVEIIGECADGASAVRAVESRRPDLLFLDVQMPRLNGFDVLEALEPDLTPLVIFTTAHDEHAIRAFEVSALDYLLKPFKQARFKATLQRAREQLATRTTRADPRLVSLLSGLHSPIKGTPRILVKSPDHILFLKPEEIEHIEAAGNYVVLHAGKGRHIVRDTMAAMETRLDACGFMRISRSAIVNLNCIAQVQPMAAPGEYCVILKNGARLGMSCSLAELQRRMGAA